MRIAGAIRGFYAVLDRDDEALAAALVDPARGGARVLQVRIKPAVPLDTVELVRIARMARRVTRDAGAALVIDDRVDVALVAEADGVHLGQTDLPLADARRLAPRLWIGVSTHNLDQVVAARDGGADYLGFGPVFATGTKRNPDPVQGVTGLTTAVAAAGELPVVAIGGITPSNVGSVVTAGAAAACVIAAVTAAPDPVAAARAIAAAWSNQAR